MPAQRGSMNIPRDTDKAERNTLKPFCRDGKRPAWINSFDGVHCLLQRRCNEFSHIQHFRPSTYYTLQHRRAVRTTDRDDLRIDRSGVVDTDVRDTLLAGDVRERRSAATAAAPAAHAVALHLNDLDSDRFEQLARRFRLAVIAAEIARIVIRDGLTRGKRAFSGGRELAARDELRDQ